MSKSITQDMRYRQSLMQYAAKYGVSRASRKYNKSRSYIYFWKARWDGSMASLACQSRRPHHHPNQHTEAELKLIRDMRRRNPTLGMVELWHRLQTWVYPLSGKSVPGHAQAGDVPAAKGQSSLQGKAIRTDAVSRPARSGRCEGGADEMPNKLGRTAIPVYGDRRIYTPSLSGRISRTKHLLLR